MDAIRQTVGILTLSLIITWAANASAQAIDDPWPKLKASMFGDATVLDDSLLTVVAPDVGENSAAVPVTIQFAKELGKVEQFVVLVDGNPFPLAARVYPDVRFLSFSLRLRMERAGPIRALALTEDGIWHAAMKTVEVAGGGCSAPGGGGAGGLASNHGQVNVAVFARSTGSKVRFQFVHPMDTGLAKDTEGNAIAPFYIHRVAVKAGDTQLYTIELSPISQNPTFSSVVDVDPEMLQQVNVAAIDTADAQLMSHRTQVHLDADVEALLRERRTGNTN